MLRAIIISALTIGIANAIHDDHGGQQTEPNLPVSSPDDLPAKDEDADDGKTNDTKSIILIKISKKLNYYYYIKKIIIIKMLVNCYKCEQFKTYLIFSKLQSF